MTEWFRTWIAKVAKDFVTCFITKDRWKYIVKGLGNTLQIALAAVLLGILIGTIVAIIRSTHDKTENCAASENAAQSVWASVCVSTVSGCSQTRRNRPCSISTNS